MITGWKLFFVGAVLLMTLLTNSDFGHGLAIGLAVGLMLIGVAEIWKKTRNREVVDG